jgi:hypothetical protein
MQWRSRRQSRWIYWLCIVCAHAFVGQRTGVINQIRDFLIGRGIIVRQGVVPLRKALPNIVRRLNPPLELFVQTLDSVRTRDDGS